MSRGTPEPSFAKGKQCLEVNTAFPVSQAIGVLCNRGCRILLSPGFQCNHLLTVLKMCPLWRKCSKLKKAAEVCVCPALVFLLSLLPQTFPQGTPHGARVGDYARITPGSSNPPLLRQLQALLSNTLTIKHLQHIPFP